jgi:hypothetical protein
MTSDDTVADLRRIAAELHSKLDERTAERDALQRELVAAGERHTATAEVFQVINSSPGELTPVFDRMVETAARICVADTAAVMRLQDGRYHLANAFGVSQEWQDFVR